MRALDKAALLHLATHRSYSALMLGYALKVDRVTASAALQRLKRRSWVICNGAWSITDAGRVHAAALVETSSN